MRSLFTLACVASSTVLDLTRGSVLSTYIAEAGKGLYRRWRNEKSSFFENCKNMMSLGIDQTGLDILACYEWGGFQCMKGSLPCLLG